MTSCPKSLLRLVLFLSVSVWSLFFFPGRTSDAFSEDFDGNFTNPTSWESYPNTGSVSFSDSHLILAGGFSSSFPYLRTSTNIFPTAGPFSLRIDFNFLSSGNFGNGLALSPNPPANGTILAPNHKQYIIFLVWQDAPGGLRLYTTTCPNTNPNCAGSLTQIHSLGRIDLGNHFLRVTYDELGVYRLFFDSLDAPIYASAPSQERPQGMWFGTPEPTRTFDYWNSLQINSLYLDAPEQEERRPVIVVPGLGASWDFDAILTGTAGNNWTIPGFVNLYDNLIDSLENVGYVRDEDLFVFSYDWRKPLYSLAEDLRGYINGLISEGKIGADEKIDLIGHSYGGLVARTYGQRVGTEKVDKIITAGSPHQGIIDSYSIWEGARAAKNVWWQVAALELTTELNQRPGERRVDTVRRLAPGIKDTLPTFDFRKVDDDVLPSSDMAQKNQTLLDMNGNFASVDGLVFANGGTGNATDRFVSIRQRDWLDRALSLWEDGKPTDFEQDEDGDGAVLGLSSTFDFSNGTTTNADHEDIISNREALTEIFEQLGLDETKIITNGVDKRRRVFIAALRSPGVLRVCRLEICDSDLGIYLPDQKLFFLPDYPDGSFDVRVSAEGETGSYRLYLGRLFEGVAEWRDVTGNLQNGSQIDNYQVRNDEEIEVVSDQQTQARTIQEDANRLNSLLPGWDKKNLLAIAISTSQPASKRIIAVRQLREILSAQAIKAYKANRSDRIESIITLWQDLDTLANDVIGVGNTTKPAFLNINISAVETYKLLADRLLGGSRSYFAARFYELFEDNFAQAKSIREENRDLSLDLTLSARYLLIAALGVR